MYKAKRFDSLYDLKDFLNENEIKPAEIIGIYRIPIAPNAGLFDLIYYIAEAESEGKMSKEYFEVEGDVVIKYTPMSEIAGNIYKTEIVMTKEIFQECYKKWIESQESEAGE